MSPAASRPPGSPALPRLASPRHAMCVHGTRIATGDSSRHRRRTRARRSGRARQLGSARDCRSARAASRPARCAGPRTRATRAAAPERSGLPPLVLRVLTTVRGLLPERLAGCPPTIQTGEGASPVGTTITGDRGFGHRQVTSARRTAATNAKTSASRILGDSFFSRVAAAAPVADQVLDIDEPVASIPERLRRLELTEAVHDQSVLRGVDERLCVLVVIGVNARGEKHFLAIEDGVRESTQSWREVLLGMKQRGFTRPAKLVVGDGAMRCRRRSRACTRSGWPRPEPQPSAPSTTGSSARRTSIPRPPRAWRAIARSCWPSTTSRASTGRACARPT